MSTDDLETEVLLDLLPVYLAGEASEASRRLIEGRMESDPGFAQLVRAAAKVRLPSPPPPAAGAEMKAFLSARRRLFRHQLMLLLAVLFTVSFGLSMAFLIDSHPAAGAVSFLLAAVFWSAFWWSGRSAP